MNASKWYQRIILGFVTMLKVCHFIKLIELFTYCIEYFSCTNTFLYYKIISIERPTMKTSATSWEYKIISSFETECKALSNLCLRENHMVNSAFPCTGKIVRLVYRSHAFMCSYFIVIKSHLMEIRLMK